MSHEKYMTIQDKIDTAITPSPLTWGVATAGLAAAAVFTSGILCLALAAGAAYTGYKTITETTPKPHHHDTMAIQALAADAPAATSDLSQNVAPIPELNNGESRQWRNQLTADAIKAAKRNAGHGY